MKTRDLIAKLQALDPEGDVEVCIENRDILGAELKPAWYDGRLQVMDERHAGGYPKSFKVTSHGNKIDLQPWGYEDAIYDSIDIPVTCDPPSEHDEKRIAQRREIAKKRLAQWGVTAR